VVPCGRLICLPACLLLETASMANSTPPHPPRSRPGRAGTDPGRPDRSPRGATVRRRRRRLAGAPWSSLEPVLRRLPINRRDSKEATTADEMIRFLAESWRTAIVDLVANSFCISSVFYVGCRILFRILEGDAQYYWYTPFSEFRLKRLTFVPLTNNEYSQAVFWQRGIVY